MGKRYCGAEKVGMIGDIQESILVLHPPHG
jgi:hypothetical protein